jgi:lysine-N-methylase
LPTRPRLAEHALVRRHLVDGEELVVIHDARTGRLFRMGPREWDLLAGADGTRDFDALVLAGAQRGAFRRASELRGILEALGAGGLLADGIAYPEPPAAGDPGRLLDVLPGFGLSCDASGVCCATYGSVLFSPLEAARARALRPEILGGGEREARAFTPARGTLADGTLSVALVDGRCAYLAGDGRCTIHAAGGEKAKPQGCQVYPATFVDDGEAVRVSIGVECPCVLASVGREGGAPLVEPGARTRGDLGPGVRVVELPAEIPIAQGRAAPRAGLAAWSRIACGDGEGDAVARLWSLARAVDADGLDEGASRRALAAPELPAVEELGAWVEALAARAKARVESAEAWRSARDRSLGASRWIAAAAAALREPGGTAAALGAGERFRGDEAFFVRASIHGHHLAGELPLAVALRDRAVRLLLARVLGEAMPADDPGRAHPIALVEAMMRGHGLGAYVGSVG